MSPPSTSWSKLAQTEIIEVSLVVVLLRKGPQPTYSLTSTPLLNHTLLCHFHMNFSKAVILIS